ncbi:MAG: hypothetical protein Q4A43_01355 [Coriobacteriia bacterium]|nr:hypothetical protein [Coriobacteriia bacterium]
MAQFAIGAIVLLAALLLLLQWAPSSAYAASKPDLDQRGSLTLVCAYDSAPMSDVECKVYELARFESDGSFVLTENFAQSGLEVNDVSSASAWRKVAEQALEYAQSSKAKATELGANKIGIAYVGNLEPGLYLVDIAQKKLNGYRYTSLPVVLSVPNLSTNEAEAGEGALDEGSWTYSVVAQPKFERTKLKGSDAPTDGHSADGQGSGAKNKGDEDESHGLLQTSDADRLFFVLGILVMLAGALGIARAARYRLKENE